MAFPARSVASIRTVYAPALRGAVQLTVRVPRPTVPADTESTRLPPGAMMLIDVREIFESENRSVVAFPPRTRVVRSASFGGSVR